MYYSPIEFSHGRVNPEFRSHDQRNGIQDRRLALPHVPVIGMFEDAFT